MGRRRALFALYLVLVVASRLAIGARPDVRPVPPGTTIASIRAPVHGEHGEQHLELAYRRLCFASRIADVPGGAAGSPCAAAPGSLPPILLLHGSPGSLQDFDALAARLSGGRLVLVPDLLGFGRSSRVVSDYSFEAQTDALLQLLDAEGIAQVHAVGFSWGGGVAITLADRAPERVASVALVSALGVEELELLGRSELNHLVHRLLQASTALADWAIPHFGAFDDGFGGRGFTRSFVDSDQGPLRGALERFAGPAIVVHGREDFLVPPAAAQEHHRILPQSRLIWIPGGHLVLWRAPEAVSKALLDFFADVEAGHAPTRAAAPSERLTAAAQPFDSRLAGPQSGLGWAVFFLLVLAASLVGEDLTCIGVGALVALGQVSFGGGVSACVFALVVGDLLLYGGGRLFGAPLLRRLGRDPREVAGIAARFERSGGLVVLLGRFVPGARLPTYVAAGMIGHPLLPFTGWLIVAAMLWSPLLVGVAALSGRALGPHVARAPAGAALAVAGIVGLALAARIVPRLVRRRDRRLLRARWQRLVRWEFWPIWAIYLPLLPAFAALALRHRSLRLPTLVNPPIPGGGLAGESKAQVGELLATVAEHAIPTCVVEPGDLEARYAVVVAFRNDHALAFPLVLKPDVGERGRDVAIIADEEGVRGYLETHPGRTLAQAFVSGEEFGLFYTRHPDAPRGRLFSLARKAPRFVKGNGRDTLERLILADPICLPVVEKLFTLQRDRLEWIPAADECVRLTQLGTHSLGCRFLVGNDLRSDALEDAVDRLSRSAGLDFGRYDVRAESEAALRAGRFRVVEFNGLTGEAAHMYDPRFGLFAGLSILFRQWRIAFEIGAAYRARGRRPLAWLELAALVRSSRRAGPRGG